MRRRPATQATQNGQIWIVRVLIGTEPTSAQIAAGLCALEGWKLVTQRYLPYGCSSVSGHGDSRIWHPAVSGVLGEVHNGIYAGAM